MSGQDPLACVHCQPLAATNLELEQALRSMSGENTALGEELAGARRTVRTLERQITKLSTDLDRAHETDPLSVKVKGVLEFWKVKTGHTRSKTPLSGDRAKLVKAKLRVYTDTELMEAIEGCALMPFVRNGRRTAEGHPSERYDQLDHCIGDEKRIETNRRRFHEAREVAEHGDPTLLWERHDHHAALAQNYLVLMLEAKCRQEVAAGNEQVVANVVRLKEIEADLDAAVRDAKPVLRLVS